MLQKINRQFQIRQMGYPLDQRFAKDRIFKGESHPFIEMVLVESGAVEISEEEKIYLLEGRDLILHNAMEFHSIKSAGGTESHFYNLSFTACGALPQQLFEGVFHLREEQMEEFMRIFRGAVRFLKEPPSSPLIPQQTADALAAFLAALCEQAPISPFSTESGALIFKKLVRDLQRSIDSNISLEELAAQNNISISYVKKLFTQHAGISPKAYFSALRAKEAAYLLDKGMAAAEIAGRMNFSSPNYFSLFFKKQMGLTPSQYKKARSD